MKVDVDVFRHILHYTLHLLVPFVFGKLFWKENWWKAGFIMMGTITIDLDHLMADPIFDIDRCSIGFHPLHFFGFGSVVFGLQLMGRGTTLKLTMEGFIVSTLLRSDTLTRWSDVDTFVAAKMGTVRNKGLGALLNIGEIFVSGLSNPSGIKTVAFNFSDSCKDLVKTRKVVKGVAGFEGCLPDNYGMKPEDLADLMNEWKGRYEKTGDKRLG